MKIDRRKFVAGTTAASVMALIPNIVQAAETIKVGSILDTSGIFDLYGKPMDKAVTLAIEEINAAGGIA